MSKKSALREKCKGETTWLQFQFFSSTFLLTKLTVDNYFDKLRTDLRLTNDLLFRKRISQKFFGNFTLGDVIYLNSLGECVVVEDGWIPDSREVRMFRWAHSGRYVEFVDIDPANSSYSYRWVTVAQCPSTQLRSFPKLNDSSEVYTYDLVFLIAFIIFRNFFFFFLIRYFCPQYWITMLSNILKFSDIKKSDFWQL